jgi:hypothetical protein
VRRRAAAARKISDNAARMYLVAMCVETLGW